MARDVGLYDSDTGESLRAEHEADVTRHQTWSDVATLVYTTAKRGRIVQLQTGMLSVHYFLDEPQSQHLMDEHAARFGFAPGDLRRLATENAPPADTVSNPEAN